MEFTGSLHGVYREFTWSPHGVYTESTWSLLILEPNSHHQVQNLDLYMESTRNLHTIKSITLLLSVGNNILDKFYST